MSYTVGDIVEVTWRQSMYSQLILNVQHYRVASSTSSSSDVSDNGSLADHLAALTGAGQLIDVWSTPLDSNWELDAVRVQKIDPTRSAYVETSIAQLGQAGAGDALPNVAVVVSKRGGSGTRRAQGSIHFAGWPPTEYTGGEIEAPISTWWGNLQPLWQAFQTPAGAGFTVQPVIYNPGATPNYQAIAVWQLQDTVRVMRRRTVRVGV